jgi:hypothetical protein
VAGQLLAMAWEMGGGLVRRGGKRRTVALDRLHRRREMRVGSARQRGRRREGRVGWPQATGLARMWANAEERGGGPRLGRTRDGPEFKKKFFSNFN